MTASDYPLPVAKDESLRDPTALRALAHPARLAILAHLSDGRAATATECADVCGLSPSATSYHLRALARAGLIEEAPSRGDGRERVWRAVHQGVTIDVGPGSSPEELRAARGVVEALLARDDAAARAWLERANEDSDEWNDASVINSGQLLMTPAEVRELSRRVDELTRPHQRAREDPPEDARLVSFVFRVLPTH